MTQKFIDRNGLKVLWNQVNLKDYPNNETLMAVIDAIDETKANKDELFSGSWNDLTDRPFYANDLTFDANINPLNNYEKVKGDLYRNISSNSVIKYIKDCTGIDINVPTNGYVAGKNLKVTITNESGEEKVVSIDNPYYIVGVTDNGYPYIRFCSGSGYTSVHEYRVEENDLVYHYVYTYFAIGAWYNYGINSNEWGYNLVQKYGWELIIVSILLLKML